MSAVAASAALSAPVAAASGDSVAYVAIGSSDTSALAVEFANIGGHVTGRFPIADAVAVRLPRGAHAPAGTVLVPDIAMRVASASDATSGPADTVRQTVAVPPGVDGNGVTVALLDTGVSGSNDLAGRVTHVNVTGAADGDGFGHGTFMAGLIAGNGVASGGVYAGLATAAQILDVKVADSDGSTSLSLVLAGLQAVALEHAADPRIRVLNVSLSAGSSALPAALNPLDRALDALWRQGITVVVAAGNDGPDAGTITSPGDDPTVITVGALDEGGTANRADDVVADFSSRGPTLQGDAKPDLVAPGAHLVSLRDPGSVIDTGYPSARIGDSYFRGSGTSMSAAVVSGAVADLLSVRSDLRPDDVKKLLLGSAYVSAGLGDPTAAGSGGLDLAAALLAPVSSKGNSQGEDANAKSDPGAGDPSEKDAAQWAAFAAAWQQGDFDATARAWAALSPATQNWAARAWAMTLWADAALSNDSQLLARAWAARAWAGQDWLARAWAARAWASDDWAARAWAARAWAARAWADANWSARAWSARAWSSEQWSARAWSARAWSADEWAARAWSVSDWASRAWAGTSWLSDDWAQ